MLKLFIILVFFFVKMNLGLSQIEQTTMKEYSVQAKEEYVHDYVLPMPTLLSNWKLLDEFAFEKMKYPLIPRIFRIEGYVRLTFEINKKFELIFLNTENKLGSSIEKEAIRLTGLITKDWHRYNERRLRHHFVVTLRFDFLKIV